MKPPSKRGPGQVPGTAGHGRPAPERVDVIEYHAPEACVLCERSLREKPAKNYTGYYEVDLEPIEGGGWRITIRLHYWQEAPCDCGHVMRAEPSRRTEEGVTIGGFRLIGPGLATLIVALSRRHRQSCERIREFLGEWLGVWLSVGAIHAAIEEAGAVVAPVEKDLIEAVQQSGLLQADETPWPEQGASNVSLWLWVFIGARVCLYFVSHRGQEWVKNVLESFPGVLMSDGWQAYRWLPQRLRCWAHLKRKAVGLSESLNREAQAFGQSVLDLWAALREAVEKAREGPPGSIRDTFSDRLVAFRSECERYQKSSHEKTRALAGEFLNDWEAIFAVLDDPRWPLTHNEAERALRHWVIYRQLTHGTRTARGSRGLALLASVIDTCRQRGHSPWDYLRTAIIRRRQDLPLLPLPD